MSDSYLNKEGLEYLYESLKNYMFNSIYPIGSIITSIDEQFNPNELYSGQSWERFANGQTLVGVDEGDQNFNTVELSGGSADAVVVSHTHTQNSHTHTQNSHNHTQNSHTHTQSQHRHETSNPDTGTYFLTTTADSTASGQFATGSSGRYAFYATSAGEFARHTYTGYQTPTNSSTTATNQSTTATNQSTTATNQSTGVDGTGKNLQPYITVYFWKRIS